MVVLAVQLLVSRLGVPSTGLRQNSAKARRVARRGTFIFWLRRAWGELLLLVRARAIVLHFRRQVGGRLWGSWGRMGMKSISWHLSIHRNRFLLFEIIYC